LTSVGRKLPAKKYKFLLDKYNFLDYTNVQEVVLLLSYRTHTAMYTKTITWDRTTKDFRMELNGEYVGHARTRIEAEVELDRLALDLISRAA
jgi:hypothetical protein